MLSRIVSRKLWSLVSLSINKYLSSPIDWDDKCGDDCNLMAIASSTSNSREFESTSDYWVKFRKTKNMIGFYI